VLEKIKKEDTCFQRPLDFRFVRRRLQLILRGLRRRVRGRDVLGLVDFLWFLDSIDLVHVRCRSPDMILPLLTTDSDHRPHF